MEVSCLLISKTGEFSDIENPTPCLSVSSRTFENTAQKYGLEVSEISGYIADDTFFSLILCMRIWGNL